MPSSRPDLFSQPQQPQQAPSELVLTVSDLTQGLRDLVEQAYARLVVEGEISDFTRARSGHCYFTLKDSDAQIRCCMWRGRAQRVFFDVKEGQLVRLKAKASVYPARGDLQLIVNDMQLAGEGALQKAFDELKQRLKREGLFDPQRKKELPSFPSCIGVVTSGSGAAIHDIRTTLERRFPGVQLLLCPVRVQGMGAAEEIARAIECLNTCVDRVGQAPEVLIVGRGGGSTEDLWAFNEETVARAIFASRLPVISAVGHETDFAIADFVADMRAATPSIAAELAVPDRQEILSSIRQRTAGIADYLKLRVTRHRQHIAQIQHSYAFRRPLDMLRQRRERLGTGRKRIVREASRRASHEHARADALRQRLRLLDPTRPVSRGYVRVFHEGNTITDADALEAGQLVTLRFRDGEKRARIEPEA